jgi:hypothetical protein
MAFDEFCSRHEGLKEALQHSHPITRDIADRLERYGSISAAQIALVTKLARVAAQPAEKTVPAPVKTGRMTIRGKVVSKKLQESIHGEAVRITVKVETPSGVWLAWGTCPAALCGNDQDVAPGDEVEFSAALKQADKPHFAFFSRPTKARMIAKAV